MKKGKIPFYIIVILSILAFSYGCSKKGPTESNNSPNTPASPSPSDNSTNEALNVNLSWSGGDPDGDPVTYDVYFGTATSPPLVSDNQTSTSYDAGTLINNTKYYWSITAEDNNGEQASSATWEFTTIKAGFEEYRDASGTYYEINGNYYDPDPVNGDPWIALSSYGTSGASAAWSFYGLSQADVETLVVGAWSYDDGSDPTGGEQYWVYNHSISAWDFWFTSDKSQAYHGYYMTGSSARQYVRATDGAVFLWLESGWTDHSHIREVYCQERGLGAGMKNVVVGKIIIEK